jgi:hypothetical protein
MADERQFLGVFVAPEDREKTFDVTVSGDFTLTVSEIWPDGGAPENPTAADVIAAMKANGGGTAGVIRDWNLCVDIEVGDFVFLGE